MKRKIMMKIGKDSSFFAKRKLNYLYSIKKCNDITVWFILTLTAVFVPIFVNSAFLDMKHTLRYDGEVNIGVLVNLHHPPDFAHDADDIRSELANLLSLTFPSLRAKRRPPAPPLSLFSSGPRNQGNRKQRTRKPKGGPTHSDIPGTKLVTRQECGPINIEAVQQIMAAKWAVDVINNQSKPNDLKIGIQLHDTCGSIRLTQRHLFQIITATREPNNVLTLPEFTQGPGGTSSYSLGPPLLGIIGVGEPAMLSETTGALHAFRIPLMSVGNRGRQPKIGTYDNILSTAPDIADQAKAIVNIAVEMNVNRIALISADHRATRAFLAEAANVGISVEDIYEYRSFPTIFSKAQHKPTSTISQNYTLEIVHFVARLKDAGPEPVIALLTDSADDVSEIAERLSERIDEITTYPMWLIGTVGLDIFIPNDINAQRRLIRKRRQTWRKVFHAGILIEPHIPELDEFKDYFNEAIKDSNHHALQEIISEYKRAILPPECSNGGNTKGSIFEGLSNQSPYTCDVEPQDPKVSFIVKAVSALTAAFRLLQIDKCHSAIAGVREICFQQVRTKLHENVLENLKKLSFTSSGKQSKKTFGSLKSRKNKRPFAQGNKKHDSDFHFSNTGRLVAGRQLVYLIDDELGKDQIGWYSEENGLYLNEFDDTKTNNEIDDNESSSTPVRNKKQKLTTKVPMKTTTASSSIQKTRIPTTTTSITSPPQITTTTTTTSPPILIVSTSSYVRTTSRPKQIHVSIPPVRRPPLAPGNLPDTETGRSSSPHFQHPKQFVGPVDRRNKENNNPPPRIVIPTPKAILHQTTTTRLSFRQHHINPTPVSSLKNGLTPDVHVKLELYMGRTWTLVAIVLAGIGACAALWMLIYVLIKICDGTLSGQQTLGLLMLVGVILMYLSVAPWLLPPNELTCAMRHFLHPLAMVHCISILLVKAMQLRSIAFVGLGGKISQVNQLVCLLFMLLVQVVISVEWYIANAPLQISEDKYHYMICDVSKNRFLLIHVYPAVLLVLSAGYGTSVLNVKTNFHEGRWITGCALAMIPVFAVWLLACHFAPAEFHDAITAFAIILLASILLCVIFIPKLYTIINRNRYYEKSFGSDEEILYRSRSESTLYSSNNDLLASSKQNPPHHQARHIHIKQPYQTSSTLRMKKVKGGAPPYFFYAPPGFTGGKYPTGWNGYNNRSNYYMGTVDSTGSIRDVWGRQRVPPADSRTVHIHGTNGARFKTFSSQPSTRPYTTPKKNFFQHPTYEEWYNPKYTNTRHRNIQTISDGLPNHHHHHHHHHDHQKPKETGFYALNLGGVSEAQKQDNRGYHHHVSRRRSSSHGADCRSRSSHSTNGGGKTSKCSSGSNGSNATRPSGKTCSSRSTKSSTKIDYNVKGSSAVILTPDTIVYNDQGLWSHKYDTSRAMSAISKLSANSTSQK